MSSSPSPIGHPAPAISMTPSNLKKAPPHRGPPPPEPQSSQPENKGALPNERHHVDPNTRLQKDASPPEPPGEYKAIASNNEQGHTNLSEEMKGLFSSSEYATTVTSPHQSRSQLVLAHGTGSSHSEDTAKTIRLRGSLDQSNSPRRNFQQGDTSNDPNSSSIMTNNTIAEISKNVRTNVTIRTGTGGETNTTQTHFLFTKRHSLGNPTAQHSKTDAQSTPPEREDGLSTNGGLGQSQVRKPTSATPPGAPLSLKRTTSVASSEHRPRQQPAHTDSDSPRLRPPILGPPLASPRDSSGHNRGRLREDDTHGPRENIVRPSGSGSGQRFPPPELPAPAPFPPPHRLPQVVVERPLLHPQTTITNTNQTESQYIQQTSDLDDNLINRRGGQPVREYCSTTFLSCMDLDFPRS